MEAFKEGVRSYKIKEEAERTPPLRNKLTKAHTGVLVLCFESDLDGPELRQVIGEVVWPT